MRAAAAIVALVGLTVTGCNSTEPENLPNSTANKTLVTTVSNRSLAHYITTGTDVLDAERQTELQTLLSGQFEAAQDEADQLWFHEFWSLWPHAARSAQGEFLLLRGFRCNIHPGQSLVKVSFLDPTGKALATTEIPTGWRIYLDSASLKSDPELQGPLIELRTGPMFLAVDLARQVYGVHGHRVALLWLEDSQGQLMVTSIVGPQPDLANRTAKDWQDALASAEPMVVIEAITWLTQNFLPDEQQQFWETSVLVAETCARPGVQDKLVELSHSTNSQIRRTAAFALSTLKIHDSASNDAPTWIPYGLFHECGSSHQAEHSSPPTIPSAIELGEE